MFIFLANFSCNITSDKKNPIIYFFISCFFMEIFEQYDYRAQLEHLKLNFLTRPIITSLLGTGLLNKMVAPYAHRCMFVSKRNFQGKKN